MLGGTRQCSGSCCTPHGTRRMCPCTPCPAAPSGLTCSLWFRGLQLPSPHLAGDGCNLHYLSLWDAHGWKKQRRQRQTPVCTQACMYTQPCSPFQPLPLTSWRCRALTLGAAALKALRFAGCCSAWGCPTAGLVSGLTQSGVLSSRGLGVHVVEVFVALGLKRPRCPCPRSAPPWCSRDELVLENLLASAAKT